MPTIILLDASLSMSRPVSIPDCAEEYQRRHLAVHGINSFLDFIGLHSKMEFVSLVVFSSLWEQLVPFTRDYDAIKTALDKVEEFNKTCLETALNGINSLFSDEWGNSVPCQVILVTDGTAGIGEGSLKQSYHTLLHAQESDSSENLKFPLPFNFSCKLHIACIASPTESTLQTAEPMYQKLIDVNGHGGAIHIPEGGLSLKSVQQMFTKMAETNFAPLTSLLKCGHLQCDVQIFPAPHSYDRAHDFEHVKMELSSELEICGFMNIADVSSPPHISRHLVLPKPLHSDVTNATQKTENATEETDEPEDGKIAAFTVLLHGALKIESMVALTQLAEDWFGILYSFADSKKKANLMLTIFQPGTNMLPWLGNLNALAPLPDFNISPYGEDDNKTPFPVKPPDRRSYAQNCVVWIKPTGLQADIQKVLRNARKLPEKQQQFYKELNRVRRAALSLGFVDLLDTISQLLDRECTMLPGNAHPDAALQLTHAANALRTETVRGTAQNIMPLRTNFSGD